MTDAQIMDAVRANIRRLMAERGVRPAPLARRAGLNEGAVRDILRGKSNNTGIVTLARLAEALGVEIAEMIEPEAAPTA